MPADAPTILATSGGISASDRLPWGIGALTRHAVDLAGTTGRAPRVCLLATAVGDDAGLIGTFYANAVAEGWQPSHLALFPMPNIDDVREHLLTRDVVWVWGGSVAGLLAMWRLHGLDEILREAWQAGVVLTGVSAGSICWHAGGTTDSFGPELRPVTNGLGLLPPDEFMSRCPPASSISLAISGPVRVSVPSSRSLPMRAATPTRSSGSYNFTRATWASAATIGSR